MNHYFILCLLLLAFSMQERFELTIEIEPTGKTGVTEVGCVWRGCPTEVLNAISWTYDNATNIVTITHNQSVTVIWINDADVSPEATTDGSQSILVGLLLILLAIILYVFQRLRI